MKGIRYRRNKNIFQNHVTGPCRIIQTTIARLEDFHKANLVQGKKYETRCGGKEEGHLEETKWF